MTQSKTNPKRGSTGTAWAERLGKETAMGRVALVTGGTRGIGAAISKSLKEAGYTVAANFGGNEEAAAKFKAETGVPVYKFDVSDAAACEAGIKTIASELGPVDILVNNAGIPRDGMFHRMTLDQ